MWFTCHSQIWQSVTFWSHFHYELVLGIELRYSGMGGKCICLLPKPSLHKSSMGIFTTIDFIFDLLYADRLKSFIVLLNYILNMK